MIEVFYADVNDLNNDRIVAYLSYLPATMQVQLQRTRNVKDLKARLLARLILLDLLSTDIPGANLDCWQITNDNKPFIEGWKQFNISHSENYVVVAVDDTKIGVDIEFLADLDWQSLSTYFTTEEQLYIYSFKNPLMAFYRIWVKKEAILKAIGRGIMGGLDKHNCIKDTTICGDLKWMFYSVDIAEQYLCFLATSKIQNSIRVEKFILY